MSNRNLTNNHSLPKSRRTYLCLPKIEESAEFLSAVKESMELHHPGLKRLARKRNSSSIFKE